MFADVALNKAAMRGDIKAGMYVGEISEIIGREPSRYLDVWRVENTENGQYTTWIVNGMTPNQNWSCTYEFRFRNGRLVSWTSM